MIKYTTLSEVGNRFFSIGRDSPQANDLETRERAL